MTEEDQLKDKAFIQCVDIIKSMIDELPVEGAN